MNDAAEHDYHREQAAIASAAYASGMDPVAEAKGWQGARADARALVRAAIEDTDQLSDIAGGLTRSGRHLVALRQMMAPPMSQDQFKILCRSYSKARENSGAAFPREEATSIAAAFETWRDREATGWLDDARPPLDEEVTRLVTATVPLLASQMYTTRRRGASSTTQESAVVDLLLRMGWQRTPSRLIDTRASLGPRQFAHKTRFATTTRPQEVDIACGLGETIVLAMECKVSNDETNSVKRVNDVLKKATSWKDHWGKSFVRTGALLQGVFAFKEVERLLDEGVHVFWSHDIDRLEAYLLKATGGA